VENAIESNAVWASRGQDVRSLEDSEGDWFSGMSWKKDREVATVISSSA